MYGELLLNLFCFKDIWMLHLKTGQNIFKKIIFAFTFCYVNLTNNSAAHINLLISLQVYIFSISDSF